MGNWSVCERTNPNAAMEAEQYGYTTAGLFGFSHMLGGYPGGQAEYLRVPYADIGPIAVPDSLDDEQVLFLSDIFPTGYQAAVNCDIKPTDTIVVFGCGPVGQFSIRSALMLGAKRVIAIDDVPERLAMARAGGAETIERTDQGVQKEILEMTQGLGPDAVIEAVGMESHGGGIMESVKSALVSTERPTAFQEAAMAVRPAGILSLPGVFGGMVDNIPMGALVQKGITMRTGQTHVQRYLEPLMKRIEAGEIDPSFLITHRVDLKDGPDAYEKFRDKKDGCIKVVMHPHG
jgi:threonine dehydrogenase-like Zn-dependent dehydrogenase